ncbi:MAG: hypothetical protein KDB53_15880, partial [Planctomycetes bacterium]|nr:hypothetical protein [Planctomycetota bacterium]
MPRLLPLTSRVIIARLVSVAPMAAQTKPKVRRSAAWEGEPMSLVCGLNNGLPKLFFTMAGAPIMKPTCQYQVRDTGP